jgi:hypothetical protein
MHEQIQIQIIQELDNGRHLIGPLLARVAMRGHLYAIRKHQGRMPQYRR